MSISKANVKTTALPSPSPLPVAFSYSTVLHHYKEAAKDHGDQQMKQLTPGILILSLLIFTTARADWPDFRGPTGDGHVTAADANKPIGLPLKWSETENVKW